MIQELKNKISSAPLLPGCYLYKDSLGKIIYVGKAKIIRNRVRSYFLKNHPDPKVQALVKHIADVEFVATDSELEALLLETNLIKKYRPKYNIDKKDDKNYIWLMIEANQDFPRYKVVREKTSKTAEYIGPYPAAFPIKRILRSLRRIFPYRTCNRTIIETTAEDGSKVIKSSDPIPCLYYQLKLCNAPCAGFVSKREYRKNISNTKKFIRSQKQEIITDLQTEMKQLAAKKKFEAAATVRDKISDLSYISQRVHIDTHTDEDLFRAEKKERASNALQELIERTGYDNLTASAEFRIECFDISNFQGTNAVASMVVNEGGAMVKGQYRKFKIKTKSTPDDFAMMAETLGRRFSDKNINDPKFGRMPNLIIVDGGKGQLSSGYRVLNELKINIPIIGLAKREEEIFAVAVENGELVFKKRRTAPGSESRFLIQRIRDESHRFAINYHRKLRMKGQVYSTLDEIPGIGKITRSRLLQAFGSLDGVRKASKQELQEIIKNRNTVEKLLKILS